MIIPAKKLIEPIRSRHLGFAGAPLATAGLSFLPPLAGHDEIGIPNAAFGTAQQPRPIDDRHPRAVMRTPLATAELFCGGTLTHAAPLSAVKDMLNISEICQHSLPVGSARAVRLVGRSRLLPWFRRPIAPAALLQSRPRPRASECDRGVRDGYPPRRDAAAGCDPLSPTLWPLRPVCASPASQQLLRRAPAADDGAVFVTMS